MRNEDILTTCRHCGRKQSPRRPENFCQGCGGDLHGRRLRDPKLEDWKAMRPVEDAAA